MIEQDMEDLIATYPDDFYPDKGFVLKGRQKSFAGVGRFDLLFEDHYKTNILMELKARPAKYEDATQIAKYKDELERLGQKNILMWLVAPQVSQHVREFLDRIGIEYSEIHITEFRRIAERHGASIKSEARTSAVPKGKESTGRSHVRVRLPLEGNSEERVPRLSSVETGPLVTRPSQLHWRALGLDLQLVNREAFDQRKFATMVEPFEKAVPSKRNAQLIADLKAWSSDTRASWPFASCKSLLRWVTTSGWKAAVPAAEAIWTYLFGQPPPTWYVWNASKKRYEFDLDAWNVWYGSLPH